MALTQEQLDQIEFQKAQADIHKLAEQARVRLELIRLAKDVLSENDRNKPVGDRGITASDITTMADSFATYINK